MYIYIIHVFHSLSIIPRYSRDFSYSYMYDYVGYPLDLGWIVCALYDIDIDMQILQFCVCEDQGLFNPYPDRFHINTVQYHGIVQYIPRNIHTVFALLCFVVVIHWLIFPYPSGLLHWHCGNLTIAPVPAKQPWWIWINTSCEFIMNDCITTTKQSTTKPCAYFLGYTVCRPYGWDKHWDGIKLWMQKRHLTFAQGVYYELWGENWQNYHEITVIT